ncbi:hypothetical protein Hanom_Chr12g01127841 [Helianthus anomalus]
MDEIVGDVSVTDKDGDKSKNNFLGEKENSFTSQATLSPRSACHFSKEFFKKDGGPRTFKRYKGRKSFSPVGSSLDPRPKKRQRAQVDKEALFGMDDLIGNGPYSFQNKSNAEVRSGEDRSAMEVGGSLDLNRRASSSLDQPACNFRL